MARNKDNSLITAKRVEEKTPEQIAKEKQEAEKLLIHKITVAIGDIKAEISPTKQTLLDAINPISFPSMEEYKTVRYMCGHPQSSVGKQQILKFLGKMMGKLLNKKNKNFKHKRSFSFAA